MLARFADVTQSPNMTKPPSRPEWNRTEALLAFRTAGHLPAGRGRITMLEVVIEHGSILPPPRRSAT